MEGGKAIAIADEGGRDGGKEESLRVKLRRGAAVGKKGGLSTPVPTWKLGAPGCTEGEPGEPKWSSASARKLAANLWEIQDLVSYAAMSRRGDKGQRHREGKALDDREAAMRKESDGRDEVEYKALPSGPGAASKTLRTEVPIIENVRWTELGLLCFVWVSFLILQVMKQYYTSTCSLFYWILNFLQVLSLGVSGYEAISLYKGRRIISSKGENGSNFTVLQLVFYCLIGVLAGMVGGLLGLGGGFILGPVFLELGVPPYSFV